MWSIVYFIDEHTVDVVPDFWYKKGFCAWPKKKLNDKKFIEKRIKPNKEDFSFYKARPLLQNIVSYTDARVKAIKAQETSELSSNDDEHQKTKRTKSNASVENLKITHAPTFDDYEESLSLIDDSDDDKTYQPFQDLVIDSLSSYESKDVSDFINDVNPIELTESQNQVFKTKNKSDQVIEERRHISGLQSNENLLSQKDFKVFQKSVDRNLVVMKHEIKNTQDRLDHIISMQENILEKLNSIAYTSNLSDDTQEDSIIFIDNDTNFELMEEKISTDINFRKKVVIELSRLCGINLAETVRKIMQKLFSDDILMKYSFIGFKGKNKFSTLQLCSIIFEAIRRMKKFRDATDVEIEKPLKNWMAQASPRLKKIARKNTIAEPDNGVPNKA